MLLSPSIVIDKPSIGDGLSLHQLIKKCPPLDSNSTYCNFLHCSHFSQTSVCAKSDKSLVGFVSAYRIPGRPNTLFVWQVAVDPDYRGLGLATKMLTQVLLRPYCRNLSFIETSITGSNQASWALFQGLTQKLETELSERPWLDKEEHFGGQHDSEVLVSIGPFDLSKIGAPK